MLKREKGPVFRDDVEKIPLKLEGYHNFLFLGGILGAVLLSGNWKPGNIMILGVHVEIQNLTRDFIIISMAVLSIITTKKTTRRDNAFTWEPIKEVAYLFAGIFMTIIPALALLKAGEQGKLAFIIEAVREPWHFFWITGALSSFLDNAPTYLTFFNTALGSLGLTEADVPNMLNGVAQSATGDRFIFILKAISAGAVFFGANTYIGNAPNFMVRSIAEENKIKMPSFLGYMIWSIGILCPLFVVVTLIFF
jgi:Na+/H+ antiporter NhaD/arsenite permease-like protein